MKISVLRMSCFSAAIIVCVLSVDREIHAQPCPTPAAPASWFPHSQTPEPDNNADFTSNCDFHRWEWQMFLWLTQPTGPDGMLRFETFKTFTDVFPPVVVADGKVPKTRATKKGSLLLKARAVKSTDPTGLDEIAQAGSGGALVPRDQRIIYYSQYINQTFYDFVTSGDKPLNIAANYLAASDTLNYPIGTLELKASWRIVPQGENTDGFYVRPAEVEALMTQNGKVVVDPDPSHNLSVTVELVGLHVVGVVKDHPEFIWATFEHANNAPDLPAGMNPMGNQPVSNKDWTFYRANTPAIACNINNVGTLTLVNPTLQTLTPIVDAFRQFPSGGARPGDVNNVPNIQLLNDSVHMQLAAGEVWRNYNLVGGVWLTPTPPLAPNTKFNPTDPNMRGSVNLSNATMETFTQPTQNCFSCHNTAKQFQFVGSSTTIIPGKNLNLSHFMVNGTFQQMQTLERIAAKKTPK